MGFAIEVLKFFGYQPSGSEEAISKPTPKDGHPVDRFTAHQDQVASFGKYSSSFNVHSILARSGAQLCEKADGTLERCTEYYDLGIPAMNAKFEGFLGQAYYSEFKV